jgi:hypothetical protein
MKKLDNFSNSLELLKGADFELAGNMDLSMIPLFGC